MSVSNLNQVKWGVEYNIEVLRNTNYYAAGTCWFECQLIKLTNDYAEFTFDSHGEIIDNVITILKHHLENVLIYENT